jgi:hypothetical protein
VIKYDVIFSKEDELINVGNQFKNQLVPRESTVKKMHRVKQRKDQQNGATSETKD